MKKRGRTFPVHIQLPGKALIQTIHVPWEEGLTLKRAKQLAFATLSPKDQARIMPPIETTMFVCNDHYNKDTSLMDIIDYMEQRGDDTLEFVVFDDQKVPVSKYVIQRCPM